MQGALQHFEGALYHALLGAPAQGDGGKSWAIKGRGEGRGEGRGQ